MLSVASQEQEQRVAWASSHEGRRQLAHEQERRELERQAFEATEHEKESLEELEQRKRDEEERTRKDDEDARQLALWKRACEPLYRLKGLLPGVSQRQGLMEIYFEYNEAKASFDNADSM